MRAEAILCSWRTRPSSIRSCQNVSLSSLTRSADVIPPSCTGDKSGQSNTHSGLEEPKSKSATKHYCPPIFSGRAPLLLSHYGMLTSSDCFSASRRTSSSGRFVRNSGRSAIQCCLPNRGPQNRGCNRSSRKSVSAECFSTCWALDIEINGRRYAVPAKSKLAGPLLTLHVVGTGKQLIEVLAPERDK